MSRTRMLTSAASVISVTAAAAGLAIAGAGGSAGAAAAPAAATVAGSLAPFTSRARITGSVPAAQRLSIQLWLRPRTAAATQFADAVSTPGSSRFHQYLSPAAWTARYGATRAQAGTVGSWLRAEGFTAVRTGPERSYVTATAPASTVNKALDVQLKLYQPSAAASAVGSALRSNDRPVSLPATLGRLVSGVTGLDNAAPAGPLAGPDTTATPETRATATASRAPCSAYYGQHQQGGLPEHFGRTSFPTQVCGYSARQLRAAYGANLASTGRGVTIAFVEFGVDPDLLLTLRDYARASGLPAPSAKRFATRTVGKPCSDVTAGEEKPAAGTPGSATSMDLEEQMDVEASYAMAPGAKELVVGDTLCGDADDGLKGLFDAELAILGGSGRHPLASIVSNSWQGGGTSQPAYLNIEHSFLLRAAAEGVGMYFATGDDPGIVSPASDPYAIAVGGTTLGIGQARNRLFETGWSDGWLRLQKGRWVSQGASGGAGGGPVTYRRQPAYQRGVVPAALSRAPGRSGPFRSLPDISADADPATAMAVGALTSGPKPRFYLAADGGTSQSTPLIAGIVAAAQQGQKAPFGFLDPVLYKLAGTSALHDVLPFTASTPARFRGIDCAAASCPTPGLNVFDIQSRADGYDGQVTLKGYDNMTGLGTPAGQNFITALRAREK